MKTTSANANGFCAVAIPHPVEAVGEDVQMRSVEIEKPVGRDRWAIGERSVSDRSPFKKKVSKSINLKKIKRCLISIGKFKNTTNHWSLTDQKQPSNSSTKAGSNRISNIWSTTNRRATMVTQHDQFPTSLAVVQCVFFFWNSKSQIHLLLQSLFPLGSPIFQNVLISLMFQTYLECCVFAQLVLIEGEQGLRHLSRFVYNSLLSNAFWASSSG